ncbi:unnamed protein product [Withania somnifera]
MAMSCSCKACQKELEDEVIAYGMKLMNPPSSTHDLLKLLHKIESVLIMVDQYPSDSMRSALQPVMNALVRNETLRHTNEDVKVSVIFCITEVSRITAPEHPYNDQKQMEEILWRTIVALAKLSDVSNHNFCKVVQILETVAKLRAFVILLDLEYDNLVIEIFKIFPRIIRPYHPHNVFTRMEQIMTQLIEDSDELSVDLLRPLLDSVKNGNQIASLISSKLGEKVLEHCAVIVKPYLAEALKSMSLNPDDCADIVASILKMPKGEEMMANENAPDIVHPVKVGPSEAKFCEPALQDDTHRDKLKDTCRKNIMTPDNAEDVQPALKAEVSSGSNKLAGKSGQHSLLSEDCNISTGGHGDVLQSQVQRKDRLHLDLTRGERTKRTLCGKRKPVRDSRKNEFASVCDAERKSESSTKNEEGNIKEHNEPSLQQIDGMKQQNDDITIKMHNIEESGEKATKLSVRDEKHLNKCANYKSGRKLATKKHEVSKRPRTIKDHGEELVGAKIKVWWPLDEAFYEAAISSFDPVKNRHKVKYIDGYVEKLNLQKERWAMLEDNISLKMAHENAPVIPKSEGHLDILGAAGDVPESQVKKKGSLHLGHTRGEITKHTVCAKRKPGRSSRKNESVSNFEEECKTGFSIQGEEVTLQQIRGMKPRKKKSTIKIYDLDESGEKTTQLSVRDETHLDKCANYKPQKKLTTGKNEDSKKPRTIKDYSEELVGARIKIWWPLDETFYEAAVSSFDPVKEKHTIAYVDGDVERLSLYKERWEMLEESSSQKVDIQREQVKDTYIENILKPDDLEDVQPAKNAELVSRKSNKVAGDVPESQVKKKGLLHLGLTNGERTKDTLCAKRKPERGSWKNESASNCDAERKSEFCIKSKDRNIIENKELPVQRVDGMEQKKKKKKTTTMRHNIEESGDKDSKKPCTIKHYGVELIGARIRIWWPLDEAFYEATVSSFDPVKRRHKVEYIDGDIEKLSLHKERWEMVEDNSFQKDHGLDFQGHVVSPSKKKAKRSSSTGPDISSSERFKSAAK